MNILIVGNPKGSAENTVEFRESIAQKHPNEYIVFEQFDRLLDVKLQKQGFDTVYHGFIPPLLSNLDEKILETLVMCIKAGGKLCIREEYKDERLVVLKKMLTLTGFVNISHNVANNVLEVRFRKMDYIS
jgi:hypothetical protein